jgi:hypothetical protein
MTPAEAIARLSFHTMPEEGAFLEMLRPYRGLKMEVLLDLEEALRAAVPALEASPLDRELMSACWNIVHLGRAWALEPWGMLRRNNLIADADLHTLDTFLNAFSYAVSRILDGATQEALGGLASYRTKS